MRSIFKGNFSQIIFLVAILAVILLIMAYLKSGMFKMKPSNIPEFEGSIAVVDNRYFNKLYHFAISLPNNDWELTYSKKADSLNKQDQALPLLDNMNLMLKMIRRDLGDTLSIVKVGIIDLLDPRTPQSLADQSLMELKQSVAPKDTLYIVAGTTLSGTASNQGAFHVVEFPGVKYSKYPIWVTMIFNYNKLAYVVNCQVKSEYYGFFKTDFENVLKSFRLFKS
jgi:hypothetical protein